MIIDVFPDKQRAKSMLELAENRYKFIQASDFSSFPTGKMESYYEIIKEISAAIILCEGFKATGENAHKDLFDFVFNKRLISEQELVFLQDLRNRRNKSYYEGKQITQIYLENSEQTILNIISKLRRLIMERL